MSDCAACSHLVERLLGQLADLLLVALSVVAVHLCSVDVRGRVDVGLVEHAHDRQDDLLDTAGRVPSLVCGLLGVEVISPRSVQDRDAHLTVGEDYINNRTW